MGRAGVRSLRQMLLITVSGGLWAGCLALGGGLGVDAAWARPASDRAAVDFLDAVDFVDAVGGRVLCRWQDPRLTEVSGIAPSIRHPGMVWVHNDSSGGPLLYGVRLSDCAVLATVTLRGAQARDFEAIASGQDARGRPTLWVGDIGDNQDSWPDVQILKVPEPTRLGNVVARPRTLRFTYPDMPHNAETLLAGPGGRLWIVTKQLANGSFYELPATWPKGDVVATATLVGSAGPLVTDGAMAADGSRFVLRDYVDARVFQGNPPGKLRSRSALPAQLQGEAVTWSADGTSLIIASERDNRLIEVPLPMPATASAGAAPRETPRPSGPPGNRSDTAPSLTGTAVLPPLVWTLVIGAVLATTLGVTEALRRRTRRRGRRQPSSS